jgi:hypothetical protein
MDLGLIFDLPGGGGPPPPVTTWDAYRALVRTLENPGMVGPDPTVVLQGVQNGGLPSGMSYTSGGGTVITGGGTSGSPRVISGWDFYGNNVLIDADHVIVTDCALDLNSRVIAPAGGPFNGIAIGLGRQNIRIEYNLFSGRRGLDQTSDYIRPNGNASTFGVQQDGSDNPIADDVVIRRNKFANISADAMRGDCGFGWIIEENWFSGMWQFEDGTTVWASGTTYPAGAYVVHGEDVYQSDIAGNVGHTPNSALGKGSTDGFWKKVGGKPHTDFTQYSRGPESIWRGNLMDATTHSAIEGLNCYFRFGNESVGGLLYHGPRRFLGNVMRPNLAFPLNTGSPIGAIDFVNRGANTGPFFFDGNEFYYGKNVIGTLADAVAALLRFGPNNRGPGGSATIAIPSNVGSYAGDPVPTFGALEL